MRLISLFLQYYHILVFQEDVLKPLQLYLMKHIITGWLLHASHISFMSLCMHTWYLWPEGHTQMIASNISHPAEGEGLL